MLRRCPSKKQRASQTRNSERRRVRQGGAGRRPTQDTVFNFCREPEHTRHVMLSCKGIRSISCSRMDGDEVQKQKIKEQKKQMMHTNAKCHILCKTHIDTKGCELAFANAASFTESISSSRKTSCGDSSRNFGGNISVEMGSPKRRPQNARKMALRSISLKRSNISMSSGSTGSARVVRW